MLISTGKGDPVSEFTFSFGFCAASVEKISCVGCHELRFEFEFWRDDEGPSPEAEAEARLEDDVLGGDGAASPKKIEEAGELALAVVAKWEEEGSNIPLLGVRLDASKEEDGGSGSGPGAPRLSGEYEEVVDEEDVDADPDGECCGRA